MSTHAWSDGEAQRCRRTRCSLCSAGRRRARSDRAAATNSTSGRRTSRVLPGARAADLRAARACAREIFARRGARSAAGRRSILRGGRAWSPAAEPSERVARACLNALRSLDTLSTPEDELEECDDEALCGGAGRRRGGAVSASGAPHAARRRYRAARAVRGLHARSPARATTSTTARCASRQTKTPSCSPCSATSRRHPTAAGTARSSASASRDRAVFERAAPTARGSSCTCRRSPTASSRTQAKSRLGAIAVDRSSASAKRTQRALQLAEERKQRDAELRRTWVTRFFGYWSRRCSGSRLGEPIEQVARGNPTSRARSGGRRARAAPPTSA